MAYKKQTRFGHPQGNCLQTYIANLQAIRAFGLLLRRFSSKSRMSDKQQLVDLLMDVQVGDVSCRKAASIILGEDG